MIVLHNVLRLLHAELLIKGNRLRIRYQIHRDILLAARHAQRLLHEPLHAGLQPRFVIAVAVERLQLLCKLCAVFRQRFASGGELSRIMLGLKNLSAQKPGIPRSMVFDEIDTGISGRMAQVVSEKMSQIGDHHQVICVTHLPQIAAMADEQFLVSKHDEDGVTRTQVVQLSREQRAQEIARMVGGADCESESSIRHAYTMLDDADRRKQELRAAYRGKGNEG